jgi:hypothetical protein
VARAGQKARILFQPYVVLRIVTTPPTQLSYVFARAVYLFSYYSDSTEFFARNFLASTAKTVGFTRKNRQNTVFDFVQKMSKNLDAAFIICYVVQT